MKNIQFIKITTKKDKNGNYVSKYKPPAIIKNDSIILYKSNDKAVVVGERSIFRLIARLLGYSDKWTLTL